MDGFVNGWSVLLTNGSFKVNLSEFYTVFSDATEEYCFEQVRWPFPPYEDRKPPLFAQFHSLPTGLKESAEYPFSPVFAVYRMISPTREVGWVSTRTWVHMLELSESDTVDLLHAQEGLLDTPRRREIREHLEELIGDPVPSWRSGCGNLVLYKEKPPKPIFLEAFYDKFQELAGDCEWTYVPWPSKYCKTLKYPRGPMTSILSVEVGAQKHEDPLTLVTKYELDEEELFDIEFASPLDWARAIGLPHHEAWSLVNALRGDLLTPECEAIRQRLDQIIHDSGGIDEG